MMYEEFTSRIHTAPPTIDEYNTTIEPVYVFHPAFDEPGAKDKAAALYDRCGLGVFAAMAASVPMWRKRSEKIAHLARDCGNAEQAAAVARARYENAAAAFAAECDAERALWSI